MPPHQTLSSLKEPTDCEGHQNDRVVWVQLVVLKGPGLQKFESEAFSLPLN